MIETQGVGNEIPQRQDNKIKIQTFFKKMGFSNVKMSVRCKIYSWSNLVDGYHMEQCFTLTSLLCSGFLFFSGNFALQEYLEKVKDPCGSCFGGLVIQPRWENSQRSLTVHQPLICALRFLKNGGCRQAYLSL